MRSRSKLGRITMTHGAVPLDVWSTRRSRVCARSLISAPRDRICVQGAPGHQSTTCPARYPTSYGFLPETRIPTSEVSRRVRFYCRLRRAPADGGGRPRDEVAVLDCGGSAAATPATASRARSPAGRSRRVRSTTRAAARWTGRRQRRPPATAVVDVGRCLSPATQVAGSCVLLSDAPPVVVSFRTLTTRHHRW